MQSEGERIRLFPVHNMAQSDHRQAAAQQPEGDPVLGCSSNAVWWAPDQLALVGAQGSLDVLQVPSGDKLMSVEHQYFLPGPACTHSAFAAWHTPPAFTHSPIF